MLVDAPLFISQLVTYVCLALGVGTCAIGWRLATKRDWADVLLGLALVAVGGARLVWGF